MSYFEENKVSSLCQLKNKLDLSSLPCNIHPIEGIDNLLFYAIYGLPSQIQCSFQIFDDLTFKLCDCDSIVAHNKFQHICSSNKFQTLTQVGNLLCFCESTSI
uniref:Uncharacterized protein n=1 Tax=Lepeophtheirus salmonis TaxID=72036 RepID=A0A0K2U069_LEPSM